MRLPVPFETVKCTPSVRAGAEGFGLAIAIKIPRYGRVGDMVNVPNSVSAALLVAAGEQEEFPIR